MVLDLLASFFTKPPEVIVATTTVAEVREVKLTHEQEVWLYRLEGCESEGRNVSIIDSNGLPSTGYFQFQSALWIEMAKGAGVYNGSNTAADYTYESQRKVAAYAVFEKGMAKRWTCTRHVGPPPINKLTAHK